ncbi:MAG: hypothetical protein BGN84_13145 [Afipia sp. 62-7]|nr:MAG: hypothetical protein BGN84_13145 [Afipia sp. 62-7]
MMAVDAIKQIDRHAEKASCFPLIDASLHQPRCGGVAQRMRRDFAVETSERHSALEGGLDRFHWLIIPLNNVIANNPFDLPAAQVGCHVDAGAIGVAQWMKSQFRGHFDSARKREIFAAVRKRADATGDMTIQSVRTAEGEALTLLRILDTKMINIYG